MLSAEDHNKLVELLKAEEGFRAEPYKDTTGNWTIGYGHKLDESPIPSWSKEWAEAVLKNDIEEATAAMISHHIASRLSGARLAVLIDMTFNLGLAGINKFTHMWNAIYRGEWDEAAREMLNSEWRRQVGRRAEGLAEMMRTGEWPDNP